MLDPSLSRRAFVASSAAAAARVLGANDRINLGLIGTGGRGTDHIRDLIRRKDLNIAITATCDTYRTNREKGAALVAQGFGAKPRTTTDYRELLSWKEVDAVIIATPDFGHPIILQAALAVGKDAYVEKPFATTFADGKAAYLAARAAANRVVAVGTQRRSDGQYMAAAQQVRDGALGKVTRVEFAMNFQAPRWKRAPESIDAADVDWKNFQLGRIERPFDARLLREWQLFAGETTNGIPGLWMSHFIDLVPWFLGDPYPLGVVSNGGVYLWKDGRKTSDVFYTLLEYPSGFMVMFSMSLTNSAGVRDAWYGTRGTLDCTKWTMSGEGSAAKDKIAAPVKIEPVTASSHMHNFLECLRSRQTPRADVQAGFSHAVAGIMSATALKEGRRVRFDPAKLELV
jgi:predicted dehydrogenase